MDVMVSRSEDAALWTLTDLLGRSMGTINKVEERFLISPAGEALKTMLLVTRGPHKSLNDALAEIETRTRGLCRRDFL
jgi:hypothetical protein